ncbi:ThiF family adenylyltransferase [Amycolatopsis sp. WQ 127309]|uniref:HesA/MoeB/ThiF family protein n=1 Tax=Amycolatopsis sp. WQ 127309 TaxID=2932773 RepID=UPI001FF2169A|nr:ThiF family adenylyltransferase [Amycolatopsis sp. WQ 127309]UOZ03585.1 ThiF family adenylyltransferase [Amycolatopsis sp. WQ 127309]
MTAVGTETMVRLRARTQLVSDGERVILRLGKRVHVLAPFDEAVEELLARLAEGAEPEVLSGRLAARFGPAAAAAAEAAVNRLRELGFLEEPHTPDDIDPDDLARLSRLVDFFSEFETPETSRFDYIRRLIGADVVVLGTGGLGSWMVYNLLCMGVGRLRLIDGDVVEASNLNRSILYAEGDVGRRKVEAARDAVRRFAPRTDVELHDRYIAGPDELVPLIKGADLLVGCADTPPWLIREWAARAGREAGVPNINVSGTRVGPLYVPGRTSCQMCDWAALVDRNPKMPRLVEAGRRLPKGNSGSLSSLAMLAGAPAALDIFRFLSGYAPPATTNAVVEISVDPGPVTVPRPPHPECPVCHGEGGQDGAGAARP